MSIATTAIDHLPETRMTVIGNLLMLLGSDTILYRTSREKQPKLIIRQESLHNPLISWFKDTFGCGLELVSEGASFSIKPTISEETMTKIRWYLHSQDDWTLASLDVISNQAKSLGNALLFDSPSSHSFPFSPVNYGLAYTFFFLSSHLSCYFERSTDSSRSN
jgi:chaperone required for assembly of F1-ATPase